MKFTKYTIDIRRRPDRLSIRDEWIQRAIDFPCKEERQADNRIRRWTEAPRIGRALPACGVAERQLDGPQSFFDRSSAREGKVLRPYGHAIPRVRRGSDFDENTLVEFDAKGRLCAMTIEHASMRAGAPELLYEQIPA